MVADDQSGERVGELHANAVEHDDRAIVGKRRHHRIDAIAVGGARDGPGSLHHRTITVLACCIGTSCSKSGDAAADTHHDYEIAAAFRS